jgi:hypothetical protein
LTYLTFPGFSCGQLKNRNHKRVFKPKNLKKVLKATPLQLNNCCMPKWKRLKLFNSKEEEDAFKDSSFEKLLKHFPDSAVAIHRYNKLLLF